ncbi:acyl-homoserine-lactone synthase [Aestuariicoccus sp. MJ-SS9]|uniref:acyl-homoserine-lactone synthase n=1 Tax=Aestuariicoccus sp. MJ-SS9 TaxID=3079855 RepID=UPI002909C884|nr:acyl-homoserine-lactone synthase [Aestuariicoccus sp. MJ-SS9]MDU8910472.1 acyl-homoserine-lactone synthase [Aestuariicoccus sp. MJ-SS9]
MIIVVDGLNRNEYTTLLEDTFRLRARVFRDRLGWEVEVENGMEIDQFDHLDPAYLISVDDDRQVVGCMRLLQTTGPHMLADVFHEILGGESPLRDPQVWEATRFCVDADRLKRGGRGRNSISYVTSEVMIGAFEYAMEAGVRDAVAVMDPVMNRVMIRSNNAPYDYLGQATPMGKVVAMAGLLDCSPERVAGIRAHSGIDGDVFATPEEADALADNPETGTNVVAFPTEKTTTPPKQKIRPADLMQYCQDQIASADTEEERRAAEALMKVLEETFAMKAAVPNCNF